MANKTRYGFPRTKSFDGRLLWLHQTGYIFSKRQNALDQAKFDRRHTNMVRIYKHPTKQLWAVYGDW